MHTSIFIMVLRAMQKLICIALFVLHCLFLHGQESLQSDSIQLVEVKSLLNKEEYHKALQQVDLLSGSIALRENWKGLLQCQNILFRIGYFGSIPQKVLPILKRNHLLFPMEMEEAKTKSTFFLASMEGELGNTLQGLRQYQSIIDPLKNQNNLSLLQGVYNDLGITYTQLGDYSRAEKYVRASMDLSLQQKDTIEYSNTIYNLALNLYFQTDFAASQALFQQFLNLFPEYAYDVYFQLGKIKCILNEIDSARIYLTESKKLNVNNWISEREYNELLSDILCKEGKFEEALDYLLQHEKEIEKSADIREKGKYYFKLADVNAKRKNWNKAQFYYDLSLENFTNNQISRSNISELRNKRFLFHEIWLGDILLGFAINENARSKGSLNSKTREGIALCIDLALEAFDFKRSFFEDIESSITSNKVSKELYENAVDIYLEWYEENKDPVFLDKAFQIAQRHNGFVLRQQINQRLQLDRYQVNDSLKRQFLEQKRKVLEKGLQLGTLNSREKFELFQLEEHKLDSIQKRIEERYPEFKKNKNDFNVSTSEKLQQGLEKHQAIIKYFEGKTKLYTFVITRDKISHFVRSDLNKIQVQIKELRSILADFEYRKRDMDSIEMNFLNVSFQLSKNLILKPIEDLPKAIQKLIIVPTGTLTQIPFESLVMEQKSSWEDRTHYLIDEFAVSYHYICKAFTDTQISKELDKMLSYGLEYDEFTLSFIQKSANDSISNQIIDKFRSAELGHLYFADDEAQEVAELFNGTSFTNQKATKKSFLSHANNFDIIHLSAHSYVDFQYPDNSAIIFTKRDSTTDNLLQVKDIDRLMFDGQLFTLSACNTFYGKDNEGEGLSSIARSFIQAGAGSVIGSFWAVPDEISKLFMVDFYSKLKRGMQKDEALRATKLEFMTNDDLSSPLYRSPAYWSAWVIYGDISAINTSKNEMLYLGIGLFSFCLLLVIKFSSVK
ncbi:MAG: CHAT domain-containing protein [Bacteroidota bacterium]